jgi:hypothetical protein
VQFVGVTLPKYVNDVDKVKIHPNTSKIQNDLGKNI